MKRYLFLSFGLAALLGPCPVDAETFSTCTGLVESVPATITTQGIWCMTHDLSSSLSSGEILSVDANNVTIDCNGFKLGGLAAGPGTTAVGIAIGPARANVTVRNCNVRGFAIGISTEGYDGVGHRVEDNRLEANRAIGIDVRGTANLVRGNTVTDTGGSTIYTGRHAIYVVGDADIVDNSVDGLVSWPGSWAMGIVMYGALHSTVRDNRVRNIVSDLPANGIQTSGHVLIEDNFVATATHPGSWAIQCSGGIGLAIGNRMLGYGTALLECPDGGDNVTLAP